MRNYAIGFMLSAALVLHGCATTPDGPSVMSLPGSGKSFEQFRQDDNSCRQYGSAQIGGSSAEQAADDSLAKSAAVGTVIGAVVGAAVGGGDGAAIGAGTGLFAGTAVGATAANESGYDAQQRYDHAYVQCMYAKGHRVPVSGRLAAAAAPANASPPPPPPPPGYRPPPPGYRAPPPPANTR